MNVAVLQKIVLTGTILITIFVDRPDAHERTITFDRNDFIRDDSTRHHDALELIGDWEYRSGTGEEWRPIRLPAPLRLQGMFTFRKMFAVDHNIMADDYMLYFMGVDGACSVYLNKKMIGSHSAGTAPFFFYIEKEALFNTERNELLIELDTRSNYSSTLPLTVRNRGIPITGDGLFRPVIMISLRRPYVGKLHIDYDDAMPSTSFSLKIRPEVRAESMDILPTDSSEESSERKDMNWEALVFASEDKLRPIYHRSLLPIPFASREVELTASIVFENFHFWKLRAPRQYRLLVRLRRGNEILDQAEVTFGISESPSPARGKNAADYKEVLRIIEWVEDGRVRQLHGESLRRRIDEDLQGIYELGADAVRVSGNAPDEYFLTVCDRLGLGVLLEVPVVNIPPAILQRESIRKKAREALNGLIEAYQSHPCIYGWGLGSGLNITDERTQRFIADLYRVGSELDHRPFYVDIRGSSYHKEVKADVYRILEISPKARPLAEEKIQMAAGLMVKAVAPLPATTIDSRAAQQTQAFNVKSVLLNAIKSKHIHGVIISPYKDWFGMTPHLLWGPRGEGERFAAGLMTAENQQRLSFGVVKAIFNNSSLPELLPADLPQNETALFQILGFCLIFIFLFFLKRDKRFAHYVKRVFIYPHGFYTDLTENRQLNSFLTGLMGAIVFVTLATLATSILFHLRQSTHFDEWLTWLLPNANAKAQAIEIIWRPLTMAPLLTTVFISFAIVQSVIFKIIIIGQRRYLRFFQIIALVIWVPAHFIFALPLVIVLFRILERGSFVPIALGYLFILFVWFFFRALRGIKVMLQLTTLRAWLVQGLILLMSAFIVGVYFEQTRELLAFGDYYLGILGF